MVLLDTPVSVVLLVLVATQVICSTAFNLLQLPLHPILISCFPFPLLQVLLATTEKLELPAPLALGAHEASLVLVVLLVLRVKMGMTANQVSEASLEKLVLRAQSVPPVFPVLLDFLAK